MGDQKNLLLAILASLVVLLGFQLLFPTKDVPKIDNSQEINDSFAPAPELIAELPKDRNEIIIAVTVVLIIGVLFIIGFGKYLQGTL